MRQINAHKFPQIYQDFGIDLADVGCVMLSTESPVEIYPSNPAEYYTEDEKKFWIKGQLDHWHVTLRYGLLRGTKRTHVDAILDEIGLPDKLRLDKLEVFESPYESERYGCLVARVEDERLNEVNAALSLIPNVNTFSLYKSHITIGYYERDWLRDNIENFKLKQEVATLDIDYGHVIV